MEKKTQKAWKEDLTPSLQNLHLNNHRTVPSAITSSTDGEKRRKRKPPPSLVSLCLGVVGKNLEDIIADLNDIALTFPADIKMALAAIARRRKLLTDDVILSLADSSWEILDISGSDITDYGVMKLAESCKSLRAVDVSCCNKITAAGVSEIVEHCKTLQTLRWGGCPRSEFTARSCLNILKPKLYYVDGDSWEELDNAEIGHGAESLRWLVWPTIDKDSLEILAAECPRITVNPKTSPFGFRGIEVPMEALQDIALDDPAVQDINPGTWAIRGFTLKPVSLTLSNPTELSMAEKFRLAFVERDTRLAPKRAKNVRQHQRRAEKEWMMMSSRAKAIALASQASRSLNNKS